MNRMYELIKELCDEQKISIAEMCRRAEIRQGLISDLKNGYSQSLFIPVRSLSMNILDITGLIIPKSEEMIVVIITNAIAAPAPIRRFLANSRVLLRLPLGSKFSPGKMLSVTPVKDLLKSSMLTLIKPFAGSFIMAYFPLNPSSTTK